MESAHQGNQQEPAMKSPHQAHQQELTAMESAHQAHQRKLVALKTGRTPSCHFRNRASYLSWSNRRPTTYDGGHLRQSNFQCGATRNEQRAAYFYSMFPLIRRRSSQSRRLHQQHRLRLQRSTRPIALKQSTRTPYSRERSEVLPTKYPCPLLNPPMQDVSCLLCSGVPLAHQDC